MVMSINGESLCSGRLYEGATGLASRDVRDRCCRSHTFRLLSEYTVGGVERTKHFFRRQQELLDAISKMSAGQIQVGSGVGVPANVIFAEPMGRGETRIRVFYQRDIRFSELRYGTRSSDYRFGYAELYIRRNGNGEGTLIPAAKIRLRGTLGVEDFGSYPARGWACGCWRRGTS